VLERASARETAARVAAGAVARVLLAQFDIAVASFTVAIGSIHTGMRPDSPDDWEMVASSPVRCPDPEAATAMIAAIDAARTAGDTLGGIFQVEATGVPIGLGSHVHWDRRLDGLLARALMSIPSVKAVEFGRGFGATSEPGSEIHDVFVSPPDPQSPWHRATNNAGGIEGGMSNGEPIVARVGLKPIPTLAHPLPSVDLLTGQPVIAHHERSDVCVVPAAGVVGEAMVCLELADALLEKYGGDSLQEIVQRLNRPRNGGPTSPGAEAPG
jgi:chorismate synthase